MAYDQAWYSLAHIGLSPEAQTEAAQDLIQIAPQASESPRLIAISSVESADLQRATVEIRAAITGETKLRSQRFMIGKDGYTFLLPKEIAANIAADELSRQSEQDDSEKIFVEDFSSVWGINGGKELKMSMVRYEPNSCQQGLIKMHQPLIYRLPASK
jgi:hypothetical protein